jgi:hypothetical protein
MHCVAESKSKWCDEASGPLQVQARLMGISGLLPGDLTNSRSAADEYIRRIWDQWWRERESYADLVLPGNTWRLHGLRPANHPQRRLALASHWTQKRDLPSKLERWCSAEITKPELGATLFELLRVGPDDFWSWHWTLRSKRLSRSQPLLGGARVTDLAVNVVLPWLWARATEGREESVSRRIEERYFAWPAAEDNSLLRHARQRLLGGAPARVTGGAAGQQGLIQLLRDFCDHSNSICENCKLPQLVSEYCAGAKSK